MLCAGNSNVSATCLTLTGACVLHFQAAMTQRESCMNLVPSGRLRTALSAPVSGMESAAAPREFRAAVGFHLLPQHSTKHFPSHRGP